MNNYQIIITNSITTITIRNIKCTDYAGDPKFHIGFTLEIVSSSCKFTTDFEEMVFYQFEFKQGTNRLVDENNIDKILVIDRDRISLHYSKNEKEINEIDIYLTFNFSPDKIEDFKIELKAYVDTILHR